MALPGRVVAVSERDGTPMAQVEFGSAVKDVCLHYVPEVEVGDYVVVHLGFAIQRLDEQSARETLATLERLGLPAGELGGLATP